MRRAALNGAGLILVFGAGAAFAGLAHHSQPLRVLNAFVALVLVVVLTRLVVRSGSRDRDILLKRATDLLDERKRRFLAALDEQ